MHKTQEIRVQSLGQKDPLEEEMATHSSILSWESHGQRSLVDYSSWGHRVRHDWVTELKMEIVVLEGGWWFRSCRLLKPLARGIALWAYIPKAKDPAQSSVVQRDRGHWSWFCWSSLQTPRCLPSLQQWRHKSWGVSGLPWWSRVKTLPSTAESTVLIAGQKTKIHMLCSAAKKKKRELRDLVLQQPRIYQILIRAKSLL